MMVYRTPGTRLTWANLSDWCAVAGVLSERRDVDGDNQMARAAHVEALPLALVAGCDDVDALATLLWWLIESPPSKHIVRPLRGHRADAPHTPLIMAAKNRLAQLARAADTATMPIGHNRRAVIDAED